MSNHDRQLAEYINLFETWKKEFNSISNCGKMWCSTCGGYGYFIEKTISEEEKQNLSPLVNGLYATEFSHFEEWRSLIERLFPKVMEVHELKIQRRSLDLILLAIDRVDTDNIRELDSFLFYNRFNYALYYKCVADEDYDFFYSYSPFMDHYNLLSDTERNKYQKKYEALLEIAIELAIKTQDESLVESLAIILKYKIKKYPELVTLCMAQCSNKVLYNCLGVTEHLKRKK